MVFRLHIIYFLVRRFIDAFWLVASGFMLASADWPGLIICVMGLIGTQLITGAIRSRGQRL